MNKAILLGRLTKDPEIRYTQAAEPLAVATYTLAVNRRFKRDGEPDADFFTCKAFGKAAEFAQKYLQKGRQVLVDGRISIRSWDDNNGQKRWATEIIIENQHFADSKPQGQTAPPANSAPKSQPANNRFFAIDESLSDEDMLF